MKENCNTIIKVDGEKEGRLAKWQMGLRESQGLFKDKRHLRENRANNNQEETGK